MSQIIEIKKPVIKKHEKIILSPLVKIYTSKGVSVRRIERTDEYLRIDFIHYADPVYINGGWVQIKPETFIRPAGTSQRLVLVKTEGIPMAPTKHYYKSIHDKLSYSLYFPSVSKDVEFIDIIEKSGGDNSFFNFYGVALSKIVSGPIVISGIYLENNGN